MTIRAVVFDLFGTLVPTFPSARNQVHLDEMIQRLGAPRESFLQAWSGSVQARDRGELNSLEDSLRHVYDAIGHEPAFDSALLADLEEGRRELYREVLEPRRDALPALRELKAAGLRTGLLSDCNMNVVDVWDEMPLAELIEEPVFSAQVRLKKPDPRIFELAARRLGCSPGECLYVGDGGSDELAGSTAVGMRAILLRVEEDELAPEAAAVVASWDGERIASLAQVPALATG